MNAVESLSQGGTPPGLVIIDDGWQQTDLDVEMKVRKDAASVLSALQGDLPDSEAAMLGRESYIEGETDAIAAVLREIPEGTATGKLLQEVKAAEDIYGELDHAVLARQHDAATAALEARHSRNIRAIETAISEARTSIRRGNLVIRLTGTLAQYIFGLIVGAFQALVLIFYQWIVDPADDGTWPVRFFAYLTGGPLRVPMLEFYADQTNFTRRLVGVKANSKFHSPEATPDCVHSSKEENLAAVVSHLKSELNVRFVYCWHGLSAYWCGVSPEATSMQRYQPRLVFAKPPASLREIEPSMLWNPSVIGGIGAVFNPKDLFNDMHSYLSSCGITGVKVDCQAGVGMVGSVTGGGPSIAARYHSALEDSISRHFPNNDAINCMCHSTENIYRWRDTAVARASDDFYPSDTASHSPHIAACAYNGMFLSALALPDFDMFHSRHRAAELHAAARAVSGGPVYVSDAPGKHSFEILKKLVLPDGHVLRCKLPGRPTRDCLFVDVLRDGQSLLKIWNMNNINGVVGVFHLQGSSWDRSRRRFSIHNLYPPQLSTAVRASDIEMFRKRWRKNKANGNGTKMENGIDSSCEDKDNGSTPSEESAMTTVKYDAETESAYELENWNNVLGTVEQSGYDSDTSSAVDLPQYAPNGDLRTRYSMEGEALGNEECPEFAAYVYSTGELHRTGLSDEVHVALDTLQASIVTFAPIISIHGLDFAVIGLKDMLNSGGALISMERVVTDVRNLHSNSNSNSSTSLQPKTTDVAINEGSRVAYSMIIKGRGSLLAFSTKLPSLCCVEGKETTFQWNKDNNCLIVDVPQQAMHTEQNVRLEYILPS